MTKHKINQNVDIFFAKQKNLKDIYDLMKAEFPYVDLSLSEFKKRFFNKNITILCAFLNDKFVGFIDLQITNENAMIVGLAIKPEFRNQSIATQLIKKAFDFFKKNKCKKIILEVQNNNIYAIKLYEKFGFKFFCNGINELKPPSSILYKYLNNTK